MASTALEPLATHSKRKLGTPRIQLCGAVLIELQVTLGFGEPVSKAKAPVGTASEIDIAIAIDMVARARLIIMR
jgi:hypothetical protein